MNKTQRQLCKRLAGPLIPFSWSCLVWKRVSLWLWSLRGSQQPFSSVLGHFRHGDEQTNERTNNQVILVQACSWPVWEGSLLQNDLAPLTALSAHIGPQYQHRTFVWMLVQSQGCTMNIQRRINSIWHQRAKCHHHCLDLKNSKLSLSLPESLSNQGIKTLFWATYQGNPSKTT